MKEPRRENIEKSGRATNWTTIALVFGLILLVIIVALLARSGNSDQDKLTNAQVATSSPPPRHDKLCASTAAYDQIKGELFRRAAELRGSDQATFDRLSTVAVVRMENPVMESEDNATGAVNCSGSLSLDLPPGVAAVGGRRTLMGDVDYTVTAAADGSGQTVLLRNADAIISSLSRLVQVPQPGEQTTGLVAGNDVAPEAAPGTPIPPPEREVQGTTPSAPPQPLSGARGTNCSTVQSQAETAMCKDPGLAELDREMAAQYSRALAIASPDQRALLRDTARRFTDFRDRCSTSSCIRNAYNGRMREIGDILQDRWQPPR